MDLNPEIWRGKRVLVTGHTGFKGSWLVFLLKELASEIIGLSLSPNNVSESLYLKAKISSLTTSEYFVDIRNLSEVKKVFEKTKPDYVFHLAAQSFVRRSVLNPIETISTNILGTTNVLLSALSKTDLYGVIIATTDKVYQNTGTKKRFEESDPLGGKDPYSASKAATELVVNSLLSSCNPNEIPVVTVRAGNVIGGGDWGEDRLVPDIVKALNTSMPLKVRSPEATRPFQHVLDCLRGYILTAQAIRSKVESTPTSLNFGPYKSLTVMEVINIFEQAFGSKVSVIESRSNIREAEYLELDSNLARNFLNWKPLYSPEKAIKQTADWYFRYYNGADAQKLMLAELTTFKEANL